MALTGKSQRVIYLATAFVTLLFMGLIYAWSLFVEPMESFFGWDRAQTSFIFTLSMISFSLGMVAAGMLERRFSPRFLMIATAVLIAGGFVAAAATVNLISIYISYGIIVGFGVGVGTDCVMSVTLKWFPEKQGIASGCMLMGFGMGAMLLSPFVTLLLGAVSWQVTFLILGACFGLVLLGVAFLVKLPAARDLQLFETGASDKKQVKVDDYSAIEMIKTRTFWMALLWLILVSSGGLGLISQAVPAAQEVLVISGMDKADTIMLATAAMGGISLCNGLGRLGNGFIWDKVGHRVSFVWVSVGFVLSMALCGFATMSGSFPLIVAGFMVLGLVYGGNMSLMAFMSSGFFGPKYFGINYAVITLQMIVSATLGPLLLAQLQSSSGSYLSAFWVFMGIAVLALVVSFLIKKPAPKVENQVAEETSK